MAAAAAEQQEQPGGEEQQQQQQQPTPEIQKWSKQRLAETTQIEQMKPIVADIALRLGRQWDLLDELHTMVHSLQQEHQEQQQVPGNTSETRRRLQISQTLERLASKEIHSLKVLHRDTQRQCQLFYQNFPESSSSSPSASSKISPLFQRQLGQAFKEIYARHALTIETMAEIVIDLRGILIVRSDEEYAHSDSSEDEQQTMNQVKSIVTTFLKSRLLTQLLCDHIVDCTMHQERKPHGAISVNVNVAELVQSAATEARHLVEANFISVGGDDLHDDYDYNYDDSHSDSDDEDVPPKTMMRIAEEPPEPPQVLIEEEVSRDNITATLVRPWLQYALVELLKNSLAITMERDRRPTPHHDEDDAEHSSSSPFWPTYVRIYETDEHVVIQLLDQGGGFFFMNDDHDDTTMAATKEHKKKKFMKDWFEFANRNDKWDRMDEQQTYAMVRSPIRGLGVGLALSRLHLRLFGGDLILEDRPAADDSTLEGHGSMQLQSGVTATLLLAKNFGTLETDIY